MNRGKANLLSILACALLCAGVSACGQKEAAQKPPVAGDTAVAKVGEDILSDKDVKTAMKKVVKKAVKEAVKEAVHDAHASKAKA